MTGHSVGDVHRSGQRPTPQSYGLFLLKGGFPMCKFSQALVSFLKNEDGPTAVEYAVMLALIVVVCITAITTLGTNANNTFSYVGNKIGGASS